MSCQTRADPRRAARNRANARASTGPRTAAGKAASAGNARRHGLSTPGGTGGEMGDADEAVAPARRLAGPHAAPGMVEAALWVADAQIALRRVRLYREGLLDLEAAPPARVSAAIGEPGVVDRYERPRPLAPQVRHPGVRSGLQRRQRRERESLTSRAFWPNEACARRSWRDPAGGRAVRVGCSGRPLASVA